MTHRLYYVKHGGEHHAIEIKLLAER